MGVLDYIRQEGRVLRRAPLSFIGLLAVGLSAGFWGGMAWRGQEVANAKSEAEAAQMLVRATEAQKALSDQQLTDIKNKLKEAAPSAVDILGEGKKAEQLKSAFSDSGWHVGVGQAPVDNLVLRAQDDKAAATIQQALKDAGINYKAVLPKGNGTTDFLLGPSGDKPKTDN